MNIVQWVRDKLGAKARVAIGQLLQLGEPVWGKRDGKVFAKEGFKQNVVVFRCVDLIAKSLASIPLIVKQNGEKADENHPLVKLLKRPNALTTRARLVHDFAAFRLITGNSYLEKMGPGLEEVETSAQNPPNELWVWEPYNLLPVARKGERVPVGYRFDDGQTVVAWKVNPVDGRGCILHWKTFNPLNRWLGMSPLEAMGRAVDQRNAADEWNQSLLQNNATPSGVITSDVELNEPQIKQLLQQIEDRQMGPRNAKRPLILGGKNIKWNQSGLSPQEMDYLEGKNASSRDICAGFGVPTQLAGIKGDQTFANFAEARLSLWEDTVLPTGLDMVEEFNFFFMDDFPGSVIEMDLDAIPALAPRRQKLWDTANASNFISSDEKRDLVKRAPLEKGQGDGTQILVQSSNITLEEVTSDVQGEDVPRGSASLDFPPGLSAEDAKKLADKDAK